MINGFFYIFDAAIAVVLNATVCCLRNYLPFLKVITRVSERLVIYNLFFL